MTVDLLIPNFNGRTALELCIESIACHTPERHRVIVYDDGSTNPGELEYLSRARDRGLINEFIFSGQHRGHGAALNFLVNEWGADKSTDFAVIIDNDIQILRSGWLPALLALADSPQVLAVCDYKDTFGYCSRGYRPEMFMFWFGLLNMKAYRDGMQTDWARADARRGDEPWRSKFASLYPPEDNAEFKRLLETQSCYADFDRERVIFNPGAALSEKMRYGNPNGYTSRPLTPALRSSFRHWGHGQHWLEPAQADIPRGRVLREQIGTELKRLREGT